MSVAVAIILNNFSDNMVFFYSPHELEEKNISGDRTIRIGGLVKQESVKKQDNGLTEFIITDLKDEITIIYQGILPPMFREGQGMVAKGKLNDNKFIADELLTKHDENYMPPEVADALKKSGKWKEGEQ